MFGRVDEHGVLKESAFRCWCSDRADPLWFGGWALAFFVLFCVLIWLSVTGH